MAHGKKAVVLLDEYDARNIFRSARTPLQRDLAEDTTFGFDSKTFDVGMDSASMTFEGFFRGKKEVVTRILDEHIATDDEKHILTFAKNGLVVGNRCIMGLSYNNSVEVSSPLNDMVMLNAGFQLTGGPRFGVSLGDPVDGVEFVTQNSIWTIALGKSPSSATVTIKDDRGNTLGSYTDNPSNSNAATKSLIEALPGIGTVNVTGTQFAGKAAGNYALAANGGTVESFTGGTSGGTNGANAIDGNGATSAAWSVGAELILDLGAALPITSIVIGMEGFTGEDEGGTSDITVEVSDSATFASGVTLVSTHNKAAAQAALAVLTSTGTWTNRYVRVTFNHSTGSAFYVNVIGPGVDGGSRVIEFASPAARRFVVSTATSLYTITETQEGKNAIPQYTYLYWETGGASNGTAVDNGESSFEGYTAHFHCVEVNGTTPTVNAKIQHSDDNVTWVDLVEFAELTAAGSERKVAATGTIKRYSRLVVVVTGTGGEAAVSCVFSRQGSAL